MAKEENTVKAVILRDYWDENGERHNAGAVVDVSKDVLIDGMGKGILAHAPSETE